MRTLYVIRAIHSAMDLGKAAARVREHIGESAWQEHQRRIDEYWNTVASCVEKLDLQWESVNLYHDSLVANGDLGMQMIRSLAANGSKDFQLTLRLLEKGATLCRTEDIDLLLADYHAITSATGAASDADLLARCAMDRDIYIANRISSTLLEGRNGLLIIGATHRVEEHLPAGIRLVYIPCSPE